MFPLKKLAKSMKSSCFQQKCIKDEMINDDDLLFKQHNTMVLDVRRDLLAVTKVYCCEWNLCTIIPFKNYVVNYLLDQSHES